MNNNTSNSEQRFHVHEDINSDVPPLTEDDLKTSYFEFWPTWLFYLPMKIYAVTLVLRYGLTTPTLSNPLFDGGGFAGESKSQILDLVPEHAKHYFAKHALLKRTKNLTYDFQALKDIQKANDFEYPYVIKPDIGCRGVGVQIASNDQDVKDYLKSFPVNEAIQIQELHDYPYEAGVFYIRHPNDDMGHIFSLTLKYFPKIIGDGVSTIQELIENNSRAKAISHIYIERHRGHLEKVLKRGEAIRMAFAGSHSRGTIFKNGNPYITEKMTQKIDEISKHVPEFYFGRYDIRFHRLSDLETGKNMKIIEINGATAEATHIWDSNMSLWGAYKTLMTQYKYLFKIGHANKKRGFVPMAFKGLWKRIKDDEDRFKKYPNAH